MPTLGYYLHQLRVLPMNEIVRRAADISRQNLRARAGKARALLFGTDLSNREFFDRAFGSSFPEEAAALAHFRKRRKISFFLDAASLPGLSGSERASVIRHADRTCDHIFDLLGSGDVGLGEKIDWHRDFKSGYRWKAHTYFTDIKIAYGKADIKVPWELSRFSHAVTLGQAYWLTQDEKYSREFTGQVSDWIDSNKAQFGVNWACTMDVGIRACNWTTAYTFFRDSAAFDEAFLLKFLKSLYRHGLHIRANLEYSDALTLNHYLANLAGLAYLGTVFPDFTEGAEWKTFAVRELIREMEKQVYPDGCDFEASTCYHRLVLELFFYPTLVVVMNDPDFNGRNLREVAERVFGTAYVRRLHSMFCAVLHLLSPDGRMPQIGDNDSGRLHTWTNDNILDMRYLLVLAAVFFGDSRFKVREFGFCPDALWVFGDSGKHLWNSLPDRSFEDIPSISFPDAGWYVMRNNGDCMVVSCGPNGQKGTGGHGHNDKLSFTLCFDGKDLLVNPGTFVYTADPASRNLFRSTASHNTVSIAGLEQNRFDLSPRGLFRTADGSQARVKCWQTGPEQDRFVGEHFGFDPAGRHHEREIIFFRQKRMLEIRDTVFGSGPKAIASFHLAPDVIVQELDGRFKAGHAIIAFEGHSAAALESYEYSAEYGKKEPGVRIRATFAHTLTTSIFFRIAGKEKQT